MLSTKMMMAMKDGHVSPSAAPFRMCIVPAQCLSAAPFKSVTVSSPSENTQPKTHISFVYLSFELLMHSLNDFGSWRTRVFHLQMRLPLLLGSLS